MKRSEMIRELAKYLNRNYIVLSVGDKEGKHLLDFIEKHMDPKAKDNKWDVEKSDKKS